MENASKALLMAAEVLVGVLLLSLMATIIYFFTNYQAEIEANESAKEVYKINSQFQVYEQKGTLTAQDVLSIYNLTENYNDKVDENQKITINGVRNINNNEYLKDNQSTYKMEIVYYKNETSKIETIKITKTN